jgi:hypothetical protein
MWIGQKSIAKMFFISHKFQYWQQDAKTWIEVQTLKNTYISICYIFVNTQT